jgi:BON domain
MLRVRGAALTGLGVGIGLMYFLDPGRGRRRRGILRDKLAHTAHLGIDAAGATGRDLSHRTAGLVARLRSAFDHRPVDDVVLVERVRSQLGRLVTRPHAIAVDATAGRVRLRGAVLRDEAKRLLRSVERVRGVHDVVNELDVREQSRYVPGLQGSAPRL